jgi:tetratricopeptide (TPR) repeat protein
MNKQSTLQLQAVTAAKNSDWKKAVIFNEEILETNSENLGALNRLGLAYVQIGKKAKAKKTFKQALEIDSSNKIAKKNLEKIKNKQTNTPNFSKEHFIEEPGKTTIVELHRLAGKTVLINLTSGSECQLKIKNRYIAVEANKKYLGTLPEDLSFRLTKLINRGNEYDCFIHSISVKSCQVHIYIKEVLRSKKNINILSFPANKDNIATINDIDEKFLLEDNIPMEIVHTDTDSELMIENVQPKED